jgi:hypothetical protein
MGKPGCKLTIETNSNKMSHLQTLTSISETAGESANEGNSKRGFVWPVVLGVTAGLGSYLYLNGFLAFAGLREPAFSGSMRIFWTALSVLLGIVVGSRIMLQQRYGPKGISSSNDITRLTGLTVWVSIPKIEGKELSEAEDSASKRID